MAGVGMLPYHAMPARKLPESVAVVGVSAILVLILTFPLAFEIGHVGRVNSGDGQFSIWNVAWVARALVLDPAHVYDANIFYPHRGTLAYSESNLGAGLLAIPAYWTTRNPYFALNTVVLLAFLLSAIGTYLLVRALTGDPGASAVSAITYAFCPFVFARLAHIQLLMTAGLPFSLLAFHRLVERQTIGRVAALALALVAQALACGYYGIFAALMVGAGVLYYGVARGLWRRIRYAAAIVASAALSMVLILPFFLPYLSLERDGPFRTLDESRNWSATWPAYAASNAWAHRWMLAQLRERALVPADVLFPGFLVTGLALAAVGLGLRSLGAAGRPAAAARSLGPAAAVQTAGAALDQAARQHVFFHALLAILAVWVSFGPGAGLYSLLYRTLPAFSLLRAPSRFAVLLPLALSVLAGLALAALTRGRRHPNWIAASVALVAALELAAIPLDLRERIPVPAANRMLASLPPGPVAEFPFFYRRIDLYRHSLYMLFSTAHWHPLVNGYSDYIPDDFDRMLIPISSFPTYESFDILRRHGARYAIFHLNLYDYRSRAKLLDRLEQYKANLRPLTQQGDDWLFEIVSWPE